MYGDKPAALARFAHAYEALAEPAPARLAVEHDEQPLDLADVLGLHGAPGAR